MVIMYIVFLVVILVSFITGIIITIIDSNNSMNNNKIELHEVDSASEVRKCIDNGSVINNLVDSNANNNQVREQENDSIKIQSVNQNSDQYFEEPVIQINYLIVVYKIVTIF